MQITKAEFVKSILRAEDLPTDRPIVAFVGRSNVGKSSLINALVKQKDLSRVSATPGRTQYLNLFTINDRFSLVDLPGYGFAKVGKSTRQGFQQLIHDFLTTAQGVALIIVIVDARIGLTDLDRTMLDQLSTLALPCMIVANKIDKLSKTEALAAVEKISREFNAVIVPHSTVTGAGRGQILETIEQALRTV